MFHVPVSELGFTLIRHIAGKRPKLSKLDSDLYRVVPDNGNEPFYLTSQEFAPATESEEPIDGILILSESDVTLLPNRSIDRQLRATYEELTQCAYADVPELTTILGVLA